MVAIAELHDQITLAWHRMVVFLRLVRWGLFVCLFLVPTRTGIMKPRSDPTLKVSGE